MSGGITYDGHISMLGITELELGSSENSYSRARKRSVIVVLEVSGCHTGCPLMNCCTAYGQMVLFVQLANQARHNYITISQQYVGPNTRLILNTFNAHILS